MSEGSEIMKKKQKRSANYLDLIPIFHEAYSWNQNEEGMVTIYIENKGLMNRLAQRLFHKPMISQVHLDEMGSFILPLIDGKKSVGDIALLVKEHFGDQAEPLYNRLVTYMHTLESYGFVEMHA